MGKRTLVECARVASVALTRCGAAATRVPKHTNNAQNRCKAKKRTRERKEKLATWAESKTDAPHTKQLI